jgi:hypothetical protein
MNPPHPPITGDHKLSTLSNLFDALDQALADQMNFSAQGDFVAAQEAVTRVGQLIVELLDRRPVPPEHRERLAQFEQRQKMARLAMIQKRQDLDLEFRRVRSGRKMLKFKYR